MCILTINLKKKVSKMSLYSRYLPNSGFLKPTMKKVSDIYLIFQTLSSAVADTGSVDQLRFSLLKRRPVDAVFSTRHRV